MKKIKTPQFENDQIKDQKEEDIDESDDEAEKDPYYAREEQKQAKKSLISPEDRERLHFDLAEKFVKSKIGKIRKCVKLYIWLNKTFTEQIMFKNQIKELEALKLQHARGHVEIPTELEALMIVEAHELIKLQYDHLKGQEELTILLARNRNKGEDILAITGVEKKIKLSHMRNTWEFTRRWSMSVRYLELFFHILIS